MDVLLRMTPQEALAFLDQCVSTMPGSRADHIRGIEAVQTLQKAIAGDEDDGAGV